MASIRGNQSSLSLATVARSSSVPQQFTTFNTASNTTPKQIVDLVNNSSSVSAGNSVTISVNYSVDNGDSTLTGIGLRLHYDSSKLSYETVTNLLQTNSFGNVTDNVDNEDLDGDTSTNRYIQFQYVDFEGNWPNQSLPVKLANFTFNTSANFQKSKINVTAVDVASGYTMEARPLDLVALHICGMI